MTKLLTADAAGVDEALTLLEIVWTTAPLTVAVVVISFGLLRNWVEGQAAWMFGAAVLCVTTLFFNPHGWQLLSSSWDNATGNLLVTFPVMLAVGYFKQYFWWPFVCSLVVGVFGGWAMAHLYEAVDSKRG